MRFLKGHTGMVLACTESVHDANLIATGSEDCSVRLWDARTLKSVRRLSCSDPVAAVSDALHADQWLVASGPRLVQFDLRGTSSVIVSESSTMFEATDDIGDLDIWVQAPLGNNQSGADSIPAQLLDLSLHTRSKILLADDDGVVTSLVSDHGEVVSQTQFQAKSIVNSVRFLSENLSVSGGFDNTIVLLDTQKATAIGRFPMAASMSNINPPHIHSIDALRRLIPESSLFCCGVGDGSVVVADVGEAKRKNGGYNWEKVRQSMFRSENMHSAAVSCVRFITDSDRIGSCGNDKVFNLMRRSPNNKLNIIHRFDMSNKANAICFPKSLPDHVLVCDTDNDAKVMPML